MKFNSEQLAAIEAACKGENLFISGPGGTGKTVVIHEIERRLKADGKKIMICAPSGTAAQLIGGVTCHRAFGFPSTILLSPTTSKTIKRTGGPVKYADVIIVDEISLCRVDLFDAMVSSIRKVEADQDRHLQLIVVGDFFQLPPVTRSTAPVKGESSERDVLLSAYGDEFGRGYCFQSPFWKELDFVFIELRQVMRAQDPEYIYNMNLARIGDWKALEFFQSCTAKKPLAGAIDLVPTIEKATQKNHSKLIELHQKIYSYRLSTEGEVLDDEISRVSRELLLCKGARVFSVINDSENCLYNGLQGTVESLDESSVTVHFDNGITSKIVPFHFSVFSYRLNGANDFEIVEVGNYTQIPLQLAYAITIHKAQGATFNSVNLDPYSWDPGQLYVGLSRCRNIKYLYVGPYINSDYLIADPLVKDFYECLSTGSEFNHYLRPAGKDTASKIIRVPSYLAGSIENACKEWHGFPVQDRYRMEIMLCPSELRNRVMQFIHRLMDLSQ